VRGGRRGFVWRTEGRSKKKKGGGKGGEGTRRQPAMKRPKKGGRPLIGTAGKGEIISLLCARAVRGKGGEKMNLDFDGLGGEKKNNNGRRRKRKKEKKKKISQPAPKSLNGEEKGKEERRGCDKKENEGPPNLFPPLGEKGKGRNRPFTTHLREGKRKKKNISLITSTKQRGGKNYPLRGGERKEKNAIPPQ